VTIEHDADLRDVTNTIVHQDIWAVAPHLPTQFVDVLVLDPPYNLSKTYNGLVFQEKQQGEYQQWFAQVIHLLKPTLKPTATVYVCADWKTSLVIAPVLEATFHIRNRITWEREKGRGTKTNWKNSSEDIWFCTLSDQYTFNVDAVKIKRKVIAPYRTPDGKPKDWDKEENGNFRLTYPSNIWTDITVPFWSMPENTDHPTQKPEKLIAKLVLASSHMGDMVFDPFLGSGTTAVVARKLGRQFLGVEIDQEYCCWAMKRLSRAKEDPTIQGYRNKVFWERNTSNDQAKKTKHE
jgi:site-specific DNA-methyltransferase (adenine-specific)